MWTVSTSDEAPAALLAPEGASMFGRESVPLVEIFTADEQRTRSSQGFFRSAVGTRLRVVDHTNETTADAVTTSLRQRDPVTGVEVNTVLLQPTGSSALQIRHSLTNTSGTPVVLTAVVSAAVGLGRSEADLDSFGFLTGRSEWLAENRWERVPLRRLLPRISLDVHGQDGRGHSGITSHGAWSAGEYVPGGMLTAADEGEILAWQFETSTGWHADLSQNLDGGVLALLGPTDMHHQFAHELLPGQTFEAVPVGLAWAAGGISEVAAELTTYRRWLRRERRDLGHFPVIYNDFMNTLMGQPTTEQLLPLVEEAATAGIEVFCMDAGWFAEPAIGDWWATVGEWQEARTRYSGGLREVVEAIHARGMRSGLWLEPEVVGVESPAAQTLPDEAFFQRFGRRVREADRYHLDFRHPAARAHMDEVVDRLVADYGISYLKLDYNINPGVGTEFDATAAGAGLLGHVRAFRDWLVALDERHPGLLVENCSSGAMRMDYSLLAVTHLQSTSDQQDFLLYPPVAVAAPMQILPEQCGNWAYPAVDMNHEESVFTLVNGLSGRFYLSGFLADLTPEQKGLVAEAVSLHAELREDLASAVPFWPLGLPDWDAPVMSLGLRTPKRDLLFVWDRTPEATDIILPGVTGDARQLFPGDGEQWSMRAHDDTLLLRTLAGPTARVLEVSRSGGGDR